MSHVTTVTHHDSRDSGGAPASRRRLRHIGAVLAGSIVLGALLLVLANLAFAQSAKKKATPHLKPFLVEDIYPGPGDSGPEDIVSTAPRTTFFRAWDKKHGEELWKTDGTAKGTNLIKDINPDLPPGARCKQGDCGIPKGWSHPDTVTVMGKQVFFAADDGKHGVELWKSDGTKKGTKLVKDINTSSASNASDVGNLVALRKRLYFSANDGKHGVEL